MTQLKQTDTVGWYCDIPRELKEEFDKLYPKRGSAKALTMAAIKYAIEQKTLVERKPDA